MTKKEKLTDEDIEALKELAEIVRELKENGILGMIKEFAKNSNDLLLSAMADPAITRGLALISSILNGIAKADIKKLNDAQIAIEKLAKCGIESIAIDPKKVKRATLFELIKSLNDPDFQYGIGLLITIAKQLGENYKKLNQ
jgi:uncharacterized protein YjgD (DUF1641 family)